MPMHVVIPDKDPLIQLLERRAVRRGLGVRMDRTDRGKLRKRLPKLARSLISERLSELEQNGDPLEVKADNGSRATDNGARATSRDLHSHAT